MKRTLVLLVAVVSTILAFTAVAMAQEDESYLDGKLRFGQGIQVGAGQTVEGDLYAFGGDVNIDGVVQGDLIAFAGTVSIGGVVEGDLIVGSGTVTLTGTVGGDVRAGAGQVTLRGDVGEDVLAGTGQLKVTGDVGEDLVFGAGLVQLDGTVAGDVLGRTGSYTNTGSVLGTEDVTIEDTEVESRPNPALQALSRFASLLVLGLLLLWLGRSRFKAAIAANNENPGRGALLGLAFLVSLVVAPFIVTFVGILLALLFGWLGLGLIVGLIMFVILLTWVLAAAVGFIMVAIIAPLTVGTWLAARFLPEGTAAYLAMAIGIAVIVLLGMIPVVGPLVGLVVSIMGAGAWLGRFWRTKEVTPTAAVIEP